MNRLKINKEVMVSTSKSVFDLYNKCSSNEDFILKYKTNDSTKMAIEELSRSVDYCIPAKSLKNFCNYNVIKQKDSYVLTISFECDIPKLKDIYFNYKGDIMNANHFAYCFMLSNGEPEHILYDETLISLFYSDKAVLFGKKDNFLVCDIIEKKGE